MGYRLATRGLWKAVKWLVRRQFGGRRVPKPVLYGGGLAFVIAVALVVLSRKGGAEPPPE